MKRSLLIVLWMISTSAISTEYYESEVQTEEYIQERLKVADFFEAVEIGEHKRVEAILRVSNLNLESSELSPNFINDKGKTALIIAASKGFIKTLKILLEFGADKEATDEKGKTALILSAENGHLACLNALAEDGAEIDTRDSLDWTAVVYSYANSHWDCLKELKRQRANLNILVKKNRSILMAAVELWPGDIKRLIELGLDANLANTLGETALIVAARVGNIDSLKVLLESKGLDINALNHLGHSALNHAVYFKHFDCVKLLVESGASFNKRNNRGLSALEITTTQEIRNYLLEAVEKRKQRKLTEFFTVTGNKRKYSENES